jgi:deoxyribonuclease-4
VRIGIHTSRAKSLENSALLAAELGANTFQIFSASPRMWRAVAPAVSDIRLFRKAREKFDLHPLAVHVSYLINLATLDPLLRERSITGFRGELERASAIGAEYLVIHPGHHKGQTMQEGIAAFVLGLAEAAHGLQLGGLTVLLENTVGAGSQIGGNLEELQCIRELAAHGSSVEVGYCLDTCHLLAAGFNIAEQKGLEDTVAHIDRVLGLDHVHLIHANDSKQPLGSRLDRHAKIGEGHIGEAGFRRILQHRKLSKKPFILETPVDEEGDDRRNLDALKRLSLRSYAAKSRG